MIPICEPSLDIKDAAALVEAIRTTWISGNSPSIQEFENGFAGYCGAKYGVACNSGTTALQLTLDALGIKKGDEVIMPTFTMVATANAVKYLGAKPVFIDSDLDTWCMNPDLIEEKISDKTQGIIPVHIYGHPCDMDKIIEVACHHNLFVLEDAAEAIGSEYKGSTTLKFNNNDPWGKTGSLGGAACFSFFANKTMTCGEGGMITTDNEELAKEARLLRGHYWGEGLKHFTHKRVGYSYRMSGLQAALGLSQLERLPLFVEKKRQNAKFYNAFLKDLAEEGKVTLPPEAPWAKNTYWIYTILINPAFGITRDELMVNLAEDGIETRTTFLPMHQQPIYRESKRYSVAEMLGERGINLPSSTTLKPEQIMMICEAIKQYVR